MGLLKFEWKNGQQRPPGTTPLLSIRNVSVRLGQRLVLDDVSLDAYEGEYIRITGPNGAGKSTLLNAIMGLVPLCKGRIAFRGRDLGHLTVHERALLGIGYMRQRDNHFPALTVGENLKLAGGPEAHLRFLEEFSGWQHELPADKPTSMLSGGQKQKLGWAMTLLTKPTLLLADEPLAGVSEAGQSFTMPQGITSLWIEHS